MMDRDDDGEAIFFFFFDSLVLKLSNVTYLFGRNICISTEIVVLPSSVFRAVRPENRKQQSGNSDREENQAEGPATVSYP